MEGWEDRWVSRWMDRWMDGEWMDNRCLPPVINGFVCARLNDLLIFVQFLPHYPHFAHETVSE